MSFVVAVEVTEASPLGSVTTDATLSMKMPRAGFGYFHGSGSSGGDLPNYVKVALSPGQRVTSLKTGSNTN